MCHREDGEDGEDIEEGHSLIPLALCFGHDYILMEQGEQLKREREGKKKVRIKEEREKGRKGSCAQGSDQQQQP